MITYMVAFLCVLGLAVGQIFFKVSANSLSQSESFFELKTLASFIAAMFLYGLTSIAWVWVLQRIELGRVYPLMALAFIFVPFGSYIIFGEVLTLRYAIGIIMIVVGVIIATSA